MITIHRVTNPLQPSVGRKTYEQEHFPGRCLDDVLLILTYTLESEADGDPVDDWGLDSEDARPSVSLNGRIVPHEQWRETYPCDGDYIVVSPHVAGGSLLRTLASVAVVAASIAVAAVTAGAGFALLGMTTALTSSVLAAATSIAGNLLISALTSGPSNKSSTPTYAFDGPHSLAQSGTVIPKGYGTFQSGGNIIASFVDVEGEDQYINCLVCYGFGPARSVSSLQINGKDIATYGNVQYYVRLGANNQPPIPNFNRVVNGYPQDVECNAGSPVVVPGTGVLTQILQVDVSFPDGVWVLTSDNNLIPAVITYLVEYSVSGANNWQPVLQPLSTSDVVSYALDGTPLIPHPWCVVATDLPPNSGVVYALDDGPHNPGDPWTGTQTVTTYQPNGNHADSSKVCVGEWQRTNPALNQVLVNTWTAGYQDFVACDQSPLYNRTSIYGLAPGKYDVRVIKYGSARLHDDVSPGDNNSPQMGQQVWIHSVNEISLLDLNYPNMILVGVRALATGQLSGSSVNITALIEYGLRTLDNNILPGALQAYEEDNPACVAADMMLDGLYGGGQWPGIVAANINRFIDEWIAWAELNDELVDDGNGNSIRRHVFNGVFDNESNLWDQLNVVGRMSRAQVIPLGRDYGVFVDQADDPVQMFTMGNIVQDSFQETWMDIDSRANQIEIQFADSTRYYKQDNPLVYMDPANQDAGVVTKNVRVDGKGITIPAQAWHLARNKERQNQFLLRTGSFKCDLDSVASRPGNVVILQHAVPQWGWGGRTLPGSTASALLLDSDEIPFEEGTSYSVIVMHPTLQRYAGTVTSVAALTDVTGANTGTQLSLSSFDNENRVTRCILTVAGVPYDCPILSAAAGSVVIQPIQGCAPASGQTYTLFDTDVMETRTVAGISAGGGTPAGSVLLSTPLSRVPQDFSVYFYGVSGSQKKVRITNVKKSSEFRATIEWIDYDERVYVDGTPVIGETSAQIVTHPGVTSLTGSESFTRVSGSYVGYAQLSWQLGPDTVGVGIYGSIVGGNVTRGALPKMLARLTNYPTSWQVQIDPGQEWTYIVVGFDANDDYAAFKSAPSVTISAVGIAANLLLGSSFQSGFAYWNLIPRAGDQLVPSFADDGEAVYTVQGTAIADNRALYFQEVPPAKWSVGQYLMLSAYVMDSCASATLPNTGFVTLTIAFYNAAGTWFATANNWTTQRYALNGVTPTLTRLNTPATQVPAGTVKILVWVGVDGGPDNVTHALQVGSVLTTSHWLLEQATSTQTEPSEWADIDVNGQILDFFQAGSSAGLRTQGSVLPSFTGGFTFTSTDTSITIAWASLIIFWPDGGVTYVQDATLTITGLPSVASVITDYLAYLYFDIVNGGVRAATPTTPLGTPAVLSAAYDAMADAACRLDTRVPLTPGGLAVSTVATGDAPGSGSGGGSGGGGTYPPGFGPVAPTQPPAGIS